MPSQLRPLVAVHHQRQRKAADAADITLILFDDRYAVTLFGEKIGGGQTSRSGTDNCNINLFLPLYHDELSSSEWNPRGCSE